MIGRGTDLTCTGHLILLGMDDAEEEAAVVQDLLDDDDEEFDDMIFDVMLQKEALRSAAAAGSSPKPIHGGSLKGKAANRPRDFEAYWDQVKAMYWGDNIVPPTDAHMFKRRFRMSYACWRTLYNGGGGGGGGGSKTLLLGFRGGHGRGLRKPRVVLLRLQLVVVLLVLLLVHHLDLTAKREIPYYGIVWLLAILLTKYGNYGSSHVNR